MLTLEKLLRLEESLENALAEVRQGIQDMGGGVEPVQRYETILPFDTDEVVFTGRRPMGVLFPDGRRESAPSWKKVFTVVLQDCNREPTMHEILMDMREKLFGRNRVLLGRDPGEMRSPVQIDEGLFAETHYDVVMLMKILKTRFLTPLGYDFHEIKIVLRNE